jgi:hypothetical protein
MDMSITYPLRATPVPQPHTTRGKPALAQQTRSRPAAATATPTERAAAPPQPPRTRVEPAVRAAMPIVTVDPSADLSSPQLAAAVFSAPAGIVILRGLAQHPQASSLWASGPAKSPFSIAEVRMHQHRTPQQ